MSSSKRKIIIVGPANPYRGGIAAFSDRLAKAYVDNGDEVIVFTFKLQYPSFLFPGKTQYTESPLPEDYKTEIKINSVNPINWFRVAKQIAKLDSDAVIFQFWMPFMGPCFGTIARSLRKKGKNVISIIHNIIPHEQRPGDTLLSKYFSNSVDGVVTMADSVRDDFKKINPKVSIVHGSHPIYDNYGEKTSVSESVQKLQLDEDYSYILFFGLVRKYKGLDLLLNAMGDIRFKSKKIKLIVAGEFYDDESHYLDIIKNQNIENEVILVPKFIPDNEVGLYFNAADLIVQPYKTATQSGVTQIAYHFEKPMVVTRVGGLPEIVPHMQTGYVVEVNPTAIADAIIDFYEEGRSDSFRANCKEEKKKYSWETLLQKIDELF